jgi:hypothetical protein
VSEQSEQPAVVQTTSVSLAQSMERVLSQIKQRFSAVPPADPRYPMSILVLASSMSVDGAIMQYTRTAVASTPGHHDGWAQAVTMTRDLLMFCQVLNENHKLGLDLASVMLTHPLLAEPASAQPTVTQNQDGTRTVMDVAVADPVGAKAGPSKRTN